MEFHLSKCFLFSAINFSDLQKEEKETEGGNKALLIVTEIANEEHCFVQTSGIGSLIHFFTCVPSQPILWSPYPKRTYENNIQIH